MLWTAQGVYVTRAAAAAAVSTDVCQGTFFGLFGLNGIFGFALALALLQGAGSSDGTMLWAMAALSALATLSFVFVPLPEGKSPSCLESIPRRGLCESCTLKRHGPRIKRHGKARIKRHGFHPRSLVTL